jgi:hypothetical protein
MQKRAAFGLLFLWAIVLRNKNDGRVKAVPYSHVLGVFRVECRIILRAR